jgi:hypothetical protein
VLVQNLKKLANKQAFILTEQKLNCVYFHLHFAPRRPGSKRVEIQRTSVEIGRGGGEGAGRTKAFVNGSGRERK